LRNPRHQTCPNCGSALEITDSDGTIFEGYSPFTADEYFFESTRKIIHPEHNDQSIKGN
jgi:hypothetical protein